MTAGRDAIDEKLIFALRENARASTAQLARLVGRSRTSVQSRIERLDQLRPVRLQVDLRDGRLHGDVHRWLAPLGDHA